MKIVKFDEIEFESWWIEVLILCISISIYIYIVNIFVVYWNELVL